MYHEPMPETCPLCPNCGCDLVRKFCSNCGQKQVEGLPTFSEIVHEVLGAVFSYDGKLWRTLRALVAAPGQLTVEFVNGRRATYLGPWQLFLWLQAITFAVHQALFDPSVQYTHNKSLAILALGTILAFCLWAFELRRASALTHAFLTASHIWSFLMVVLLTEYAISMPLGIALVHRGLLSHKFPIGQYVTLVAIAAMEPYLILSLKRVYQKSWVLTMFRWVCVNAVMFGGIVVLAKYL